MEVRRASTLPAKLPPANLDIHATFIENGEMESLINVVDNVESKDTSEENADTQSTHHTSTLFKLCRLLGIDFLYFYIRKGPAISETRKVALVQDLRSACYASLLHILPVSACILLTVFNLNGYYIGGELAGPVGEDSLKNLGLQFAAKMLELTSMASLSCIMFYLIRQQLIDDVLPFGTVTSGFEFSRISLLWSKEFIATCSTKFGTARTKSFLVAAIVVFTILGATIGPSAAVASQPSLRDWPAGGTSFNINAARDQLFPLLLHEVPSSELSCSEAQGNVDTCYPPSYKLMASEILALWPSSIPAVVAAHYPPTVPEKTLIVGRRSVQQLSNRLIGGFVWNPELTVATTPMAFVADTVALLAKYWYVANRGLCAAGKTPSFCYYKDIANSIDTVQPVTYVKCIPNSINTALNFVIMDQTPGNPVAKLGDASDASREEFDILTQNSSHTGLKWVSLPEPSFGNVSLGALVAIPGSNKTTDPGYFLACTIDARWVNSTATATFLGGPLIVTGSFGDYDASHRFAKNSKGQLLWPQINITTDWAEHLNPATKANETSVFDFLAKSVARVGNVASVPNSLNAVEAILALMLTEGISRVGNSVAIQGSLKGLDSGAWLKHILPGGHVFGSAGSAFDYVPTAGDNTTKFTMETTVNGYGYGPTTATVLSIAVLVTYSIIAITYVTYSICFRQITSSTWESISELVALAVNSKSTAALKNTGAGISTLGTLKQRVWIGGRNGSLELKFEANEGDKGEKGTDSIMPNKSYG